MPMIDGDRFFPRIRFSRRDVRTIKQLKSLFRNKRGIENEVTYVINKYSSALSKLRTKKTLVRLCGCADAPLLFAHAISRFSHDVDHYYYISSPR